MRDFRWAAVLVAVAVVFLDGASPVSTDEAFASCCEDLQIPRWSHSGTSGDKIGPIVVTVVPDGAGHPSSITLVGGSDSDRMLVKAWMAESRFAPKCSGKPIMIQFSFVMEGPPLDYPFNWVTFQSPNHFIIHARVRLPRSFFPPAAPKGREE